MRQMCKIDDLKSVSSSNFTINSSKKSQDTCSRRFKEKQVVYATIDVDGCESVVITNGIEEWVQLYLDTVTMKDNCIIESGH